MTEPNNPISNDVVIVGGGVAGLEALLALRALAGDRVALTLISQCDSFVDRPMTVAEPFGLGSATRHSLAQITEELGANLVHASVAGVDAAAHRVRCADGSDVAFDTLILASGARQRAPFSDAITFGFEGSGPLGERVPAPGRSGARLRPDSGDQGERKRASGPRTGRRSTPRPCSATPTRRSP